MPSGVILLGVKGDVRTERCQPTKSTEPQVRLSWGSIMQMGLRDRLTPGGPGPTLKQAALSHRPHPKLCCYYLCSPGRRQKEDTTIGLQFQGLGPITSQKLRQSPDLSWAFISSVPPQLDCKEIKPVNPQGNPALNIPWKN